MKNQDQPHQDRHHDISPHDYRLTPSSLSPAKIHSYTSSLSSDPYKFTQKPQHKCPSFQNPSSSSNLPNLNHFYRREHRSDRNRRRISAFEKRTLKQRWFAGDSRGFFEAFSLLCHFFSFCLSCSFFSFLLLLLHCYCG